MACGRPVVATDVGGVAEAVARRGVLVPPRDPEAVAQATIDLLGDPERRRSLGRRAADRVTQHFTRRAVHRQLPGALPRGRTTGPVARPVARRRTGDAVRSQRPDDRTARPLPWWRRAPAGAGALPVGPAPARARPGLRRRGRSPRDRRRPRGGRCQQPRRADDLRAARPVRAGPGAVRLAAPAVGPPRRGRSRRPGTAAWRTSAALLFVVPAISLAVAARALHLVLPWWAFPVALTIGWAFGQATAGSAVCLRNRGQAPGSGRRCRVCWSPAPLAGAALIGVTVGHGGTSAVGDRHASSAAYVASLAVSAVYKEPWPMARRLAPARCAPPAYLLDPRTVLRVAGRGRREGGDGIVGAALLLCWWPSRHAARGWWCRRAPAAEPATGGCPSSGTAPLGVAVSGLCLSVTAYGAGNESPRAACWSSWR